jgi:hypothetical protein
MAIANVAQHESLHPPGALRAFARNLVDYAGLFPPAGLTMPDAVRNYYAYLEGTMAWMLGRFVVPASRLKEFESAFSEVQPSNQWRLSCLLDDDPRSDLSEIDSFINRNGAHACIDTIEIHFQSIEAAQDLLFFATKKFTTYVEILLNAPIELLRSLEKNGMRAKIRTGGIIPSAIPSSESIADFLANCATANTKFKATAGLHHPLRSLKPLTYEPDAPRARMHGFLNLFLAAAFARQGMSATRLVRLIDSEQAQDFTFGDAGVRWSDIELTNSAIDEARRGFAMSFGSCSFEEPIDDLRHLHLL